MKAAAFYFVLVFGTGFVLGMGRVLWLVPRVGVRAAELVEVPVMLVAIVLAARAVRRRFPRQAPVRVGLGALGMLLAAEVGLGMALGGRTAADVLFDRDPVSGSAYYLSLVVFAAMPWILGRCGNHPLRTSLNR